jgi:hypothetical protein
MIVVPHNAPSVRPGTNNKWEKAQPRLPSLFPHAAPHLHAATIRRQHGQQKEWKCNLPRDFPATNELSQQGCPLLYTPSQGTRHYEGKFDLPKPHAAEEEDVRPAKRKTSNFLPTCHKKTDLFSTADDESNLTPKSTWIKCQFSANENPGWLLRYSARKVLFQPRN